MGFRNKTEATYGMISSVNCELDKIKIEKTITEGSSSGDEVCNKEGT
jgi:hypothetical protein